VYYQPGTRGAISAHLVQRDRIWAYLDHAQLGIGTASCGPGVLPKHRLEAVPTTFGEPQPVRAFARVTSAYQRALSFGVRSKVSKSTWMSPKRLE
jgi:hypothetical protein